MKDGLVYALILSGGSGNRFGNDMPKQFADVYGKTILEYCIQNFNNHKDIDKIIVVSNPEHLQRTMQIANINKFKKICAIVEGGATRGESSYIGLKEIFSKEKERSKIKVLIQDAVRPNTKSNLIDRVLTALEKNKAVSVAVPTTDTIYISDENNCLEAIPDRTKLFKAQTPQGFNFEFIYQSYLALEKVHRFKQTDDCSIVHKVAPSEKIEIIEGDNNNLKITFTEDLEHFRQILKIKQ
ncbi:MAG: 2-C-methyl-D-erythritol 4-phosphate cytidylyltransferase [Clostridia bacterium]|nr:2-C-methyl-D-erythritol 4-phosphate cytidylyltransferase [Clostridia bacterium]